MRPRETLLVAAREVRAAVRSRWFVMAAGAFLVLSLGLSLLGLSGAERSGLAGFDRTSAGLLNLVLLFVPLVTLTVGGLSIAGDVEDGSMAMLLSQPVTRAEVFVGKYLGLLAAVCVSILLGFGATGVLVGATAGGSASVYLALVAVTLLLAMATLAIGTALSAALPSRARVIGAAFSAWIFLVYVSDLGTIGLTVARDLPPGKLFALAVMNPVQSARVLGTLSLSSRADVLGPVGMFGVDRFGMSGLVALLVVFLVATTALPLAAGYRIFRDEVIS